MSFHFLANVLRLCFIMSSFLFSPIGSFSIRTLVQHNDATVLHNWDLLLFFILNLPFIHCAITFLSQSTMKDCYSSGYIGLNTMVFISFTSSFTDICWYLGVNLNMLSQNESIPINLFYVWLSHGIKRL